MELVFLCIALAIAAGGALIGWAIGHRRGYEAGYKAGYKAGEFRPLECMQVRQPTSTVAYDLFKELERGVHKASK